MVTFSWVLVGMIAYIAGMAIILMATPRLVKLSFDEGMFMGLAALEILGAILMLGAVVITLAAFGGAIGVRIFAFLLLVGIMAVSGHSAWAGFHPAFVRTSYRVSRVAAGIFCVCLVLAALYYMMQLFSM